MHTTFPANLKFWCDFHGKPLFLFYTESGAELVPVLRYDDQDCDNVFDALALLAPIYPGNTPALLAKIANFLIFGTQFDLIEDPADFKERYQKALDRRADRPDHPASHYVPYLIEEIEDPHHQGGDLIFYNVAPHNLVPYRVTLPLPLPSRQTPIRQDLLPQAPNGGDHVAD